MKFLSDWLEKRKKAREEKADKILKKATEKLNLRREDDYNKFFDEYVKGKPEAEHLKDVFKIVYDKAWKDGGQSVCDITLTP